MKSISEIRTEFEACRGSRAELYEMYAYDTRMGVQKLIQKYQKQDEKLANERKLVSGDKLELKSLLQDLKDTDKYMGIIEERNKKIAKEKKWKEEDTESSPYAAVKPEIKINRDYFEQQGISFEEPEEEQPEEKEEDSEDVKQPEKKGFFGKFMK